MYKVKSESLLTLSSVSFPIHSIVLFLPHRLTVWYLSFQNFFCIVAETYMYVLCICASVYVYIKAYSFDKNRIIEYSSILLLS